MKLTALIAWATAMATPLVAQTIVIDAPSNEGVGFSQSNGWSTSSAAGSYNGESLWATRWDGDPIALQVWKNPAPNPEQLQTATWDLTPFLTDNFGKRAEVWVWWAAGSNRTTAASYNVFHEFGISTVVVDQTQNGGQWFYLGTYEFHRDSATNNPDPMNQVRLWNNFPIGTGSVVSADAVKFVILPDEYVADNGDDTFSSSTSWFASTSVGGYYGADYHARATAPVSDRARWDSHLTLGGSWTVYARWTAAPNRASAAPYIVYHAGGSSTVMVDQRANGGQWVPLGTWNFNAGLNKVELSCWTASGDYVIADGVKWVKN